MLISTMTIPSLQDLIRKSFQTSTYERIGDVRQLYIKDTQDWTTNIKRIQEVDRERFAEQKVEGQASAQRGFGQGYYKDIVRKTVSITRKVSGEAYQALEAHQLAQYVMATAGDVTDKIELDMANYIGYALVGTSYVDNGGFTIDLTVGDGLSLFSTVHTLKNNSTTYSNILSGAPTLTNVSLESAEDYFNYNVYDNYGQRMSMRPDTIITSQKAIMMNRFARIFGSSSPESLAGTANANAGIKNVYLNKYTHLVVPFDVDAFNVVDTTKAYYWFLACLNGPADQRFQAYYVSWMAPMVAPAEINQDKWILSYTARAAYGLGAVSGRGILAIKSTA